MISNSISCFDGRYWSDLLKIGVPSCKNKIYVKQKKSSEKAIFKFWWIGSGSQTRCVHALPRIFIYALSWRKRAWMSGIWHMFKYLPTVEESVIITISTLQATHQLYTIFYLLTCTLSACTFRMETSHIDIVLIPHCSLPFHHHSTYQYQSIKSIVLSHQNLLFTLTTFFLSPFFSGLKSQIK